MMINIDTLKNEFKKVRIFRSLTFYFILSFLLWMDIFRGFLLKEFMVVSDAIPYLEHFKFYVDQISRGVYPLWEPFRHQGVPVEFFLRRIGSFNPLYILIIAFYKAGLSFQTAYLLFWAIYYFIGMFGFYLIAKRLFNNATMAFVAYLILAFSSVGTRMFDSYILLVFVPMIWFFTFLIDLTHEPKKKHLIGLTFTLLILMTTYVPFYFITIFSIFLAWYCIFYFRNLKGILRKYVTFFKKHKWLVLFCSFTIILSCAPGFLMKQQSSSGEVVVPLRSGIVESTAGESVMQVYKENITRWGAMEEFIFSGFYLNNLKDFQFEVLYVPIFAFVLFLIGALTRFNKRCLFLLVWGLSLFVVGLPNLAPFNEFLHKHLFYFKYIRNFHFLPWLVLIPVFILIVVEQFQRLLTYPCSTSKQKIWALCCVAGVHALLFLCVRGQSNPPISSYLVIEGSFLFFILLVFGKLTPKSLLFIPCIFILIVAQPVEVYRYLHLNAARLYRDYRYEDQYLHMRYILPDKISKKNTIQQIRKKGINIWLKNTGRMDMYFGGHWYNFLREHIKFQGEERSGILLYDYIEKMDEKHFDADKVGTAYSRNFNLAFVQKEYDEDRYESDDPNKRRESEIVDRDSPELLEVLDFDVNHLKIKTKFRYKKFLVYNDNYNSEWAAFIDGKKAKLWRANIAFKGLWVPAGEHVIDFRYGAWWRYALNYLLLGLTYFFLIYLIWVNARTLREKKT